jgi:PhnB protein
VLCVRVTACACVSHTFVIPLLLCFWQVNPSLCVSNGAAALEWYAKALGAVERFRRDMPGGKIAHAEMSLGADKSVVMLSDAMPGWPLKSPEECSGISSSLSVYVDDVDAAFARAVAAGAKPDGEVKDQFWGDR